MTMVHADHVRPGDVIDAHGELHRVVHIEQRDGWAWPIASDGTGWAIALGQDLIVPPGYSDSPATTSDDNGEV